MSETKPRNLKGRGGGPYPKRNKAGQVTGYWGMVDLGVGPNGKRDRRKVSGRTKRDVLANMEEVRREHATGTLPAPNRDTLGVYLDRWLAGLPLQRRKLKTRTLVFYADVVRLHLKPRLGHVQLTRLTVHDCNTVWTDLLTRHPKPLAGKSVVGIRMTLRVALNAAIKTGILKVNVAALSDAPEVEDHEPDTLEEDELRQFGAAIEGHPLRPLFWLLATTGCRISEVLAIRQRDLDRATGDIHIEVAIPTRGKVAALALDTPKSRKGRRTVPLLPEVDTAIQDYLAEHELERRRNADVRAVVQVAMGVPADTIFTQASGAWLSYSYVERQLKKVFGTTKLPRISAHGFRHTTGTLLGQRGVPAQAIAELLGHADPGFTARVYVHNNDAGRQRVKAEIRAISEG